MHPTSEASRVTDAVVPASSKIDGPSSAARFSFVPALLGASIFIQSASHAAPVHAQSVPRTFQMALWSEATATHGDVVMFGLAQPQPSGHSILVFGDWHDSSFSSAIQGKTLDWSRIDAVVIDEPYLHWAPVIGQGWQNPCYDPALVNPAASPPETYCQTLADVRNQLQVIGVEIKQVAPHTRFWVNFSEPELWWMGFHGDFNPDLGFSTTYVPANVLITDGMDVVSLDKYNLNRCDFAIDHKPYDDFLWSHRTRSSQQLAMVPGTFVRSVDGIPQSPYTDACHSQTLPGYFAYARQRNTVCNLPVGRLGVTHVFDGCPVWLVAGYLADDAGGTGCAAVNPVGECFHGLVGGQASWTAGQMTIWSAELASPKQASTASVSALMSSIRFNL